jgi:hypothetical protein
MVKEIEIQKAILDYLSARRIYHIRVNSGAMFKQSKGKKYMIKLAPFGTPDIIACYKGKFYGLEVKTPEGEQTDHQINAEHAIKASGGEYHVVRSIDDVGAILT